jgi:hypothetical protein
MEIIVSSLERAAERICWLTELIFSHDMAESDRDRADLVDANPDLRRFLDASEAASEWDRDQVRAEVGAAIILEELANAGLRPVTMMRGGR